MIKSAVIPAFNSEGTIKETLDSIFFQTTKIDEIIVVDDGSVDGTCEEVEKCMSYMSSLTLYKLPPSGGPSKPRNFGIKKARGDVIFFCDSDDIWFNDHVERAIAYLEDDENLDGVCFNATKFKLSADEDDKINVVNDKRKTTELLSFLKLVRDNKVVCSSMVIRKCVFKEEQIFPEDNELCEDFVAWLLMLVNGVKLQYVPQVSIYYRDISSVSRRSVVTNSFLEQRIAALQFLANRDNLKFRHRLITYVLSLFFTFIRFIIEMKRIAI